MIGTYLRGSGVRSPIGVSTIPEVSMDMRVFLTHRNILADCCSIATETTWMDDLNIREKLLLER